MKKEDLSGSPAHVTVVNKEEEMAELAASFTSRILLFHPPAGALLVGLFGELGSGKTTFVKGVASALGIEESVTSPTFVIEKIYKLSKPPFKHLIHIDAYRLESGTELLHLGWKDILGDSGNVIFLEWPERVGEILPKGMMKLRFRFVDEYTREVEEIS